MNKLRKSIMGKYNAKDVDELLLKVRNDYEECLKEQKERIFLLREQKSRMSIVVNQYEESEKYIIGAITKAEETAQFIIEEAEKKASAREMMMQRNEKQLRIAIEGCYKKLYDLKTASESIFRAVSKAVGEREGIEIYSMENNVRSIKSLF